MRENLKNARKAAGLTQQQVAEYLGVSETHYQKIEYGTVKGKIETWDSLEDLFNVSQRVLREIPEIHRGKEDNLEKHQTYQPNKQV